MCKTNYTKKPEPPPVNFLAFHREINVSRKSPTQRKTCGENYIVNLHLLNSFPQDAPPPTVSNSVTEQQRPVEATKLKLYNPQNRGPSSIRWIMTRWLLDECSA